MDPRILALQNELIQLEGNLIKYLGEDQERSKALEAINGFADKINTTLEAFDTSTTPQTDADRKYESQLREIQSAAKKLKRGASEEQLQKALLDNKRVRIKSLEIEFRSDKQKQKGAILKTLKKDREDYIELLRHHVDEKKDESVAEFEQWDSTYAKPFEASQANTPSPPVIPPSVHRATIFAVHSTPVAPSNSGSSPSPATISPQKITDFHAANVIQKLAQNGWQEKTSPDPTQKVFEDPHLQKSVIVEKEKVGGDFAGVEKVTVDQHGELQGNPDGLLNQAKALIKAMVDLTGDKTGELSLQSTSQHKEVLEKIFEKANKEIGCQFTFQFQDVSPAPSPHS